MFILTYKMRAHVSINPLNVKRNRNRCLLDIFGLKRRQAACSKLSFRNERERIRGKVRPGPLKSVSVKGAIRTTHSIKPDFNLLRSSKAKRSRTTKPSMVDAKGADLTREPVTRLVSKPISEKH